MPTNSFAYSYFNSLEFFNKDHLRKLNKNLGRVVRDRIVSMKREEDNQPMLPRPVHVPMRTIDEESTAPPEHVVIVMDGLKEFTMEPLVWALENISQAGSCTTITLLGVMPWLNIPLSTKTWLDIWRLELDDLSIVKEKSEWKNDVKYLKLQAIVDLCTAYGVVPQMKVVMGYPLRQLVVEQITSLRATWVVFDRWIVTAGHYREKRDFYGRKIICNMVMMNDNGNFEVIRGRPMINN